MAKFLLYALLHLIHPLSYLFPRSERRWAFGSFRGAFNDNAKYLFLYCNNHYSQATSVWLSSSRATIRLVRSLGLKAYFIASPKGAWYALTSKYWFVNSYSSDILYAFSGGAIVVNLWHGVGLKRIEFNITSGTLADRYQRRTLGHRFYHPEVFRRPDYMLSSTPFQTAMFAPAFRIPPSRCLELGYPRNEILTCTEADRLRHVAAYEPASTQALIASLRTRPYSTVFIYMPTWRDSQRNLFTQSFDMHRLDALLQKRNALLLLKPHANVSTSPADYRHLHNIRFLDSNTDVYPLLPLTDVLITDYSSILYDYLLLPDKGIILYLYDYAEYVDLRGLFYPFDENVVGHRAYTFDQLCSCIESGDYALPAAERDHLLVKFWGENAQQHSPSHDLISLLLGGQLTRLHS
ncbi:MAG: CDP-glycerol glycerophosphotransferase family protein [Bacteroidales bacterium]|nr:CDP-glycerol glycerophosphotransferase family protein [Bacteroidales bacterium]